MEELHISKDSGCLDEGNVLLLFRNCASSELVRPLLKRETRGASHINEGTAFLVMHWSNKIKFVKKMWSNAIHTDPKDTHCLDVWGPTSPLTVAMRTNIIFEQMCKLLIRSALH